MSSLNRWLVTMSLAAVTFLIVVAIPDTSHATSQWSRKYKTSCVTCHTAFPRLNYYGERFMRNGYQDPDNLFPDGGTLGKKVINEELSIDRLGNLVGLRVSATPLRAQTNKLIVNGEPQTKTTIGGIDWYQLFIAGSISKNISIFVEAENDGHGMHFSWFRIGFHNIGGSKLLNLYVGNLSPLDYTSYSNRLRQIGSVKADVFGIKTSGGLGEDPYNSSSSRPGIMWFGGTGPVVLSAGVTNGPSAADVNDQMHYWGSVRLEIPESAESSWEGSNISFWTYSGTDAMDTASDQKTNDFNRYSVQANLRRQAWDLQVAYLSVTEDNYGLAAAADPQVEQTYGGMVVQLGYRSGRWFPCILVDNVTYDDEALSGLDRSHVTPSLSYFMRENVRIEGHVRLDRTDEVDGYLRSDDWRLNIRMMF